MENQVLNNKIFLIFISSILMGIAQQPLGLGFLAWFCLIPFIHVLLSLENYKNIVFYSFIWGFIYNIRDITK